MKRFTVLGLLLLVSSSGLCASSATPPVPVRDAVVVAEVAAFAKRVEGILAGSGARVALVARTGRYRDELPEGVRYTHVGFAVYSELTDDAGRTHRGYAMHNLYQAPGKLDRSTLVVDTPFDFFSAGEYLQAGILVPTPALQRRLLGVLESAVYQRLHNPSYSVISNPFNNRYQNCTEFVLNVIQAAIYGTDDIDLIKDALSQHYEPFRIRVNPLAVMLGALFSEELAVADHRRGFRTATFGSIERYLEKYGLVRESRHLDDGARGRPAAPRELVLAEPSAGR